MFSTHYFFSSIDVHRLLFPIFQHNTYTSLVIPPFSAPFDPCAPQFFPAILFSSGVGGLILANLRDVPLIFIASLIGFPSIGILQSIFPFNGGTIPFSLGSMPTSGFTSITSMACPRADFFLAPANGPAIFYAIPTHIKQYLILP